MYFVYVLYSLKDGKLYKGSTSNLQKRMLRHNSGGNKSTAHRKPFILVHMEQFEDKPSALKRELFLKSLEGGSKLISFLKAQHILNEQGRLNLDKR
jgi:putative endonuclease